MDPTRDPAPERAPRLFCPGEIPVSGLLELPEQAAHHAVRVLRLVPGDSVRLFNGQGAEWESQIAAVRKGGVSVRVGARRERDVEASLRVLLAQGMSARERMDFTVQKAVELGVAEIQPLETRRSVVRLRQERASRRVDHWRNLAIAACEQCGRNRVPLVHPIATLANWLGALPREATPTRLMLAPEATLSLRELPAPRAVILLAGPEGGLAAEERELAQLCGFRPVRLGPRILRTETVALAAMAAIHALWGDF
jgi:16S rRNA (uracil1498-N3)-methyltransferase